MQDRPVDERIGLAIDERNQNPGEPAKAEPPRLLGIEDGEGVLDHAGYGRVALVVLAIEGDKAFDLTEVGDPLCA